MIGYDSDKFGTVEYIQRIKILSRNYYKVYFITDSGYQTWKASKNLSKYNEERGCIDETVKQEIFHDSRSK